MAAKYFSYNQYFSIVCKNKYHVNMTKYYHIYISPYCENATSLVFYS